MKRFLKSCARWLQRQLGLRPMQKVLKLIEAEGVDLSQLDALEMFACDGKQQLIDYYRRVRSVIAWEWTARHVNTLRDEFPGVYVFQTDSFQRAMTSDGLPG